MKSYSVTLAKVAWIFGTITVEAESWEAAFAEAKENEPQASWPVNEDGATCEGFTRPEVSRAYCADEADTIHDGEPASAETRVYVAAPRMLAMLADLLKPGSVSGAVIEAGRDLLAELGHDVRGGSEG